MKLTVRIYKNSEHYFNVTVSRPFIAGSVRRQILEKMPSLAHEYDMFFEYDLIGIKIRRKI